MFHTMNGGGLIDGLEVDRLDNSRALLASRAIDGRVLIWRHDVDESASFRASGCRIVHLYQRQGSEFRYEGAYLMPEGRERYARACEALRDGCAPV